MDEAEMKNIEDMRILKKRVEEQVMKDGWV